VGGVGFDILEKGWLAERGKLFFGGGMARQSDFGKIPRSKSVQGSSPSTLSKSWNYCIILVFINMKVATGIAYPATP
jgi:hypothetical protein